MLKLAHFNVSTPDLAASEAFYSGIVGLEKGPRPNFSRNGAWMYAGSEPVVHLVEIETVNPSPTGCIDHVAFELEGLVDFKRKLIREGVNFHEQPIPDDEGWQVFIHDPSHVKLEFNFLGEFAE